MKLRLIALLLCVALLLSGCGSLLDDLTSALSEYFVVKYTDMEYTRPDMQALEQVLSDSCQISADADTLEQVLDGIYAFYGVYDNFYTNMGLANIGYCKDMTDLYWQQEYAYCAENTATVDAGLDSLYYALADSPYREELESDEYFGADYFASYDGESIWTDSFTSLMEQEAALQTRYYELSAQALETEYYSEAFFDTYGTQLAQLFVELVALRQEIATCAGYDSYPEFVYDYYHLRDYTPAQAEAYLTQIGQALTPLYRQLSTGDVWNPANSGCSEDETFRYVKTAATQMGGAVADAFTLLEKGGLYDITYGENKQDTSFSLFLWSYYVPFVFVNPYMIQTDKLTFAHEFGHFTNDYLCNGSYVGTDIAEVHSQGMEYLSLCYADAPQLEAYKLADCLCIYVEQAAYALFEQRVYSLTGDDLTVENVQALYEGIGNSFGFDSWERDSRDYVNLTHLYIEPMYMISYVCSNDLAFQLYQMEKAEAGSGLKIYQQCLESQDSFLLYFAETYGLESPFAPGRLESVKKTLEQALQ